MICNLAFAKMDRTSYSVVGAGSRWLLKNIFALYVKNKSRS